MVRSAFFAFPGGMGGRGGEVWDAKGGSEGMLPDDGVAEKARVGGAHEGWGWRDVDMVGRGCLFSFVWVVLMLVSMRQVLNGFMGGFGVRCEGLGFWEWLWGGGDVGDDVGLLSDRLMGFGGWGGQST